MQNIPVVKMGIISVSRGCFPIELSEMRRHNVAMPHLCRNRTGCEKSSRRCKSCWR